MVQIWCKHSCIDHLLFITISCNPVTSLLLAKYLSAKPCLLSNLFLCCDFTYIQLKCVLNVLLCICSAWFRHKSHLVSVQKRSRFSLKYMFWHVCQKNAWRTSHLKNSWFWVANETSGDGLSSWEKDPVLDPTKVPGDSPTSRKGEPVLVTNNTAGSSTTSPQSDCSHPFSSLVA